MGSIKYSYLLGLCWSSLLAAAQPVDSLWLPVYEKASLRYFALDPLQQLLTVGTDDEVIQYTPNGQELFRYHNTVLGDLATVDAADPFNILLFFPEQQTVVLLDRTLSDRAQLDLRTTPVQNATAAARSYDNNLWVYDDFAGRLFKLSSRGEVLFTSNDLRLSEGLQHGATHILWQGNQLLLNFPERGVAVFSLQGRLLEWWALPGITDCFLDQGQFFFRQANQYAVFLPQQQVRESLSWACTQPAFYRQQLDRRYLLDEQGLLRVQTRR